MSYIGGVKCPNLPGKFKRHLWGIKGHNDPYKRYIRGDTSGSQGAPSRGIGHRRGAYGGQYDIVMGGAILSGMLSTPRCPASVAGCG